MSRAGSMVQTRDVPAALGKLQRKGKRVTMASLARELRVSRATLYRQLGGAADVSALAGAPVGARVDDEVVFAAVRKVIGERGLRGATLETVATQAGVSVVTLRRRFDDRAGLLRAFMDALPARRAGRQLHAADPHAVRATLEAFTRVALTELEASHELMRAMLGDPAGARELSEQARDPARGVSAGLHAYFSRCVSAGTLRGDPAALTLLFLSTLFGFGLVTASLRPGPFAADSNVTLLVQGFLDTPEAEGKRR